MSKLQQPYVQPAKASNNKFKKILIVFCLQPNCWSLLERLVIFRYENKYSNYIKLILIFPNCLKHYNINSLSKIIIDKNLNQNLNSKIIVEIV